MDDSRPTPHPRPNDAADTAPQPRPGTSSTPGDGAAAARHRAGTAADHTDRRWFLLGAAAIVLGAAGGTVAELALHHDTSPVPRPAPAELLAAVTRERQLIADLDATTGGTPELRRTLVRARADHAAHLAAFESLLRRYDPPSASSTAATPSGVAPRGLPRTAAQLRAAETAAATSSARAAAAMSGTVAVLLASVSASESTHAALLS